MPTAPSAANEASQTSVGVRLPTSATPAANHGEADDDPGHYPKLRDRRRVDRLHPDVVIQLVDVSEIVLRRAAYGVRVDDHAQSFGYCGATRLHAPQRELQRDEQQPGREREEHSRNARHRYFSFLASAS
jgi:hypothetical protein